MKRMLIIISLILGLNTSVGAIDIGSDFPDPFKILPEIIIDDATPSGTKTVSYTHLTLPTILLV